MEKKKTNKKVKFSRFLVLILILSVLSSVFVISSFAAEVPTDLTDYKVTVPSGWTSAALYGKFNLTGSVDDRILRPEGTDGSFGVGYTSDGSFYSSPNFVAFNVEPTSGLLDFFVLGGGTSFTLIITGGSDASNSLLIQWLVDNNATFEDLTPPTPTERITDTWTQIMAWIISSLSSVQAVFFSDGGLTFLGILAVISVSIGLAFLLIAVISRFLSLRS